ncbi:MAG: hypothetical protein MJ082_04040 [Clostridia bacterium]|nr:hypothetical protein [Clostridia bacterium]
MTNLTPVLLGLDLNAYSVALSFYETYGVISHAFGRYPCGITRYSGIVESHVVPDILEQKGVAALLSFAAAHKGEDLFLVPCGDWYLHFVLDHRDALSTAFRMFLPEKTVAKTLSDKSEFFALCVKHGIPTPKTEILTDLGDKDRFFLGGEIGFPSVLKAADSTEYFAHPHEGQRKADFPKTPKEAEAVLERVFRSGYTGKMIWQEYIPARSAETLTVYADAYCRVRCAVRAKVLLEEQAPRARGNYSALQSLPLDGLCRDLVRFTEAVGYRGICNYDILRSSKGDCVLELNPRQGRSCDYLRAAGISLASLLVGGADGVYQPARFTYREALWRCVGRSTLRRLCAPEDRQTVEELEREGKVFSPFSNSSDRAPRHTAYVAVHLLRRGNAVRKYAKEAL